MGIRGLNTCLHTSTPSSITNVDWAVLNNKRVGVDIQCFLYRAIATQLCPLKIIAEQIVKFRKLGITPVYVFDGKPPAEKNTVVSKRRTDRNAAAEMCKKLRLTLESIMDDDARSTLLKQITEIEAKNPSITYETKNEIKKFLYATGALFVTAVSEADGLLAYLFKRGLIDIVATFDFDLIPRGTNVMIPSNIANPPGTQWSYYDFANIKKGLRLDDSQFIDLCVLMGSDYTPDLAIVPWAIALNSIRSGLSMRTIWERHTFSSWRRVNTSNTTDEDLLKLAKAKEILLGLTDTFESLLEQEQIDKFTNIVKIDEQASLQEFKKLNSSWDEDWWTPLGLIAVIAVTSVTAVTAVNTS